MLAAIGDSQCDGRNQRDRVPNRLWQPRDRCARRQFDRAR